MDLIYLVGMIIVMVWSLVVQARLKSLTKKYANVPVASGKTANECAEEMLRMNEVYGITFDHKSGELTDCYSPSENKIYLSDSTDGRNSITAVAIAAHECGHACQNASGMGIYRLRQLIAPAAGIASKASVYIAMIGLMIMYAASSMTSYDMGYNICTFGIVVYMVVFLFYLVTLPVERNASARGIKAMKEAGWVSADQLPAAKKVLRAAGDTYAVALASSALTLIRLFAMRGNRRK